MEQAAVKTGTCREWQPKAVLKIASGNNTTTLLVATCQGLWGCFLACNILSRHCGSSRCMPGRALRPNCSALSTMDNENGAGLQYSNGGNPLLLQ